MQVVRKHRLIELFLVRVLGLTWHEVPDEAERLEHAVSDLVVRSMDQQLGHPQRDPHGGPIPQEDGSVPIVPGIPLTPIPAGIS